LRVAPKSNPSTGSGSGVEGEREKAEEMGMEMAALHCSRRTVHDVLGVHGWVAVTSSGCHHRGSLLGSLDAYLHGHSLEGVLAALP
jgi:hypothetical protein